MEMAEAGRIIRRLETLNPRQRALVSHALRHPGYRYTVRTHQFVHNVVYESARKDLMALEKMRWFGKTRVGKEWIFTPAPRLERQVKGK
jgi:hypothetical protein